MSNRGVVGHKFTPSELKRFKNTESIIKQRRMEKTARENFQSEMLKYDRLAAYLLQRELTPEEKIEYDYYILMRSRYEGMITIIRKTVPDLATGGDKEEYGLKIKGKDFWFKEEADALQRIAGTVAKQEDAVEASPDSIIAVDGEDQGSCEQAGDVKEG